MKLYEIDEITVGSNVEGPKTKNPHLLMMKEGLIGKVSQSDICFNFLTLGGVLIKLGQLKPRNNKNLADFLQTELSNVNKQLSYENKQLSNVSK